MFGEGLASRAISIENRSLSFRMGSTGFLLCVCVRETELCGSCARASEFMGTAESLLATDSRTVELLSATRSTVPRGRAKG